MLLYHEMFPWVMEFETPASNRVPASPDTTKFDGGSSTCFDLFPHEQLEMQHAFRTIRRSISS